MGVERWEMEWGVVVMDVKQDSSPSSDNHRNYTKTKINDDPLQLHHVATAVSQPLGQDAQTTPLVCPPVCRLLWEWCQWRRHRTPGLTREWQHSSQLISEQAVQAQGLSSHWKVNGQRNSQSGAGRRDIAASGIHQWTLPGQDSWNIYLPL